MRRLIEFGGARLRKIYRIYEKDLGDPAEHHDTDEHLDTDEHYD